MPLTLNGTTGIAGVDGSAGTPALRGTDTNTGIVFGSDTLSLATGGNSAALTVDANSNVTFPATTVMGSSFLRNRIINGDMRIDQRNAGASVTPADGAYTLDRFQAGLTQSSKFSVIQSSVAPAGFINSLLVTSLSAYSVVSGDILAIAQKIEGLNISDLGWGTSSALTVTISFWVRSSLTGTFGGSIRNSAQNRSYPFTYSISSANTWEYKTVTIAGDTTGTWLTTNGVGINLSFGLGVGSTYSGTAGSWASANYVSATGATSVVGTNGATLYITGLQLEVGSVATPFERRQYGQELALCQRYYEKSYDSGTVPGTATSTGQFQFLGITGVSTTTGSIWGGGSFKVSKRTGATMAFWDANGNSNKCNRVNIGSADNFNSAISLSWAAEGSFAVASSTGNAANSITFQWTATAEL